MYGAVDMFQEASRHETKTLGKSDWLEVVSSALQERLAVKERVLLCLTGKAGSGKTTLARRLRKKGIPGFKSSEIAVIDDGVMTVPLFGLINRRVRIPTTQRDDLAPFAPYLRRKKLVVYVAIKPEQRLTCCDVLMRVRCDEEERRRRLISSRSNGEFRYENSLRKSDDIVLPADIYFDFQTG